MNAVRSCLQCGVCCFSALDTYVRVTGADWTRLGAEAERLAHFVGNRAYMRMHEGHCAALEVRGSATIAGESEYFCTIYERRPQLCRDLARGSPECLGELATKSARVVIAPSIPHQRTTAPHSRLQPRVTH